MWQARRILRRWHQVLVCSLLATLPWLAGCSSCSSNKNKPLEPLAAPSWRVDLPVPGYGAASVALPLGSHQARPIVVVLHGGADRPEWQCGSFRGLLGGRVFIVCPRGVQRPELGGRFGLGSLDDTAAELRAALKALKQRFGGHVAASPIVLIGFGKGAAHAAELARQEPTFFSRVALIAGDPTAVTPSAAHIFAKRGGKRLLFFCTSSSCQQDAAMRATLVQRAGAGAKVVQRDVGPYLDQRLLDALKEEVPWLLAGDERWPSPPR
jgi:predicted esterase